MNIPKSFKLNSRRYSVRRCDMDKEELWGEVNSATRKVRVHQGESLPKEKERQVFLHEVTHAILGHMGEFDLKKNERFVDGFAQLWDEYEATKKF